MTDNLENEMTLRELYYSPKTGYRSAEHLYTLAHDENPNISRNFVKRWLEHQDSFTKFKKYSKPQYFRQVFVRYLTEQVQVDLVSMTAYKSENEGYQYILTGIEILSRYGFAVPVKDKSAKSTLAAFKIFLSQFETHFGKKFKAVQWDQSLEFLNRDMREFLKKEDIVEFSTHSKRKATVVERLNRTLRDKMVKMFEKNQNQKWLDSIDNLVPNYNRQPHRVIKMQPINVNEENQWIVWGRLYAKVVQFDKPRYKIGDKVRVLDLAVRFAGKEFSKKYRAAHPPKRTTSGRLDYDEDNPLRKPPFSNEVYRIEQVSIGDPITYKLFSEEFDFELLGQFYESELSLVR